MTQGTHVEDEFYTVELAAQLTARNPEVILRYIRNGIVVAEKDPNDRRAYLIPWDQLGVIVSQPKRGYRKKVVRLTRSDGSVVKINVAVQRNG